MQSYTSSSSDVHYASTNPSQNHYSNGNSNATAHLYNNYTYSTTGNTNSNSNTNTNSNGHSNTTPSPSASSSTNLTFAQRIKKLDHQNNIPNEFRVYTTHGAFLSFTTILLLLYLISTEYTFNLTRTTREKVYVNTDHKNDNHPLADLLEMEIDITFPDIPCALLSIDAFDPNNQRQSLHLDNKHRVWKHRIGKNGKMIGRKSKVELGMTLQHEDHLEDYAKNKNIKFVETEKLKNDDGYYDGDESESSGVNDEEDGCGSCYGAGDDGECCNTCDDVKRAYQRKGWLFDPKMDVKQCHDAKNSNEMIGEGCNVHGLVALSTGGGNLHITPGHELENFGKTFAFKDLADLINQAFETFNVTHTIKKLRFGREYPGEMHQLDGEERMADDVYGMYQYYFQIVPTEYRFLNGTTIRTNQYSVIEHMRHVNPGANRGLPGVYFFYEVSPLHVLIEEYSHGWIQFLTSVAAVVGGVISAMKMMDAYIFSKSMNQRVLST